MTRRIAGLVLLGALACGEPTVPTRADFYSFDRGGAVFHWPATRLPVRFWADPRGNMRFLVQRGIDIWTAQLLYGEFSGTLVSDSSQADVLVSWTDSVPPDVPPDTGAAVIACGGVTSYPPVNPDSTLQGPLHVQLSVLSNRTAAQVAACMRRTAVHDLGHALGILQESPDAGDVMYASPLVAMPSTRDRNTMQLLYHTTPTLRPAPR